MNMSGISTNTLNKKPKGYLLQPQLEAEISKLLGDHKMTVFRGFTQNYDDITIHYMDWRKDEMDSLYLRAGKGDIDGNGKPNPNFLYWRKMMRETFKPIKKFMDEETEKKIKELEQRKIDMKNK